MARWLARNAQEGRGEVDESNLGDRFARPPCSLILPGVSFFGDMYDEGNAIPGKKGQRLLLGIPDP